MFKYLLPAFALTATAIAVTTSASVAAEEYQAFTEIRVDHFSASRGSENGGTLSGLYYFDKIETLGPLNEFEYIIKKSNIGASVSRVFDTNLGTVAGQYFAENNFVVSASHSRTSDFHANEIGLGYLFADNILVTVNAVRPRNGDTTFSLEGNYEHKLQGNDYIGFTASVDEEFDFFTLSSKYFASVGQQQYIAIGAGIADNDGSTAWNIEGDYYLSKMTSVGVGYTKDDDFSIEASHFFTKNWALNAGYNSNADNSDLKIYSVSVTGQF